MAGDLMFWIPLGGLVVCLIVFLITSIYEYKQMPAESKKEEKPKAENKKVAPTQPVENIQQPKKELSPVKEEPKQEEKAVKQEVVETVTEQVAVAVAPIVEEEELDDTEDDREKARRIPFSEKMLSLDSKSQEYYDELNNKFKSLRNINVRVSAKGVSYRLGRVLVAKITVRGKTMKLHLALDCAKFEEKIYFQKDLSAVKAYAEVPFTVKVKSDRGARNAIKLIDALAQEKGIENKARYIKIDSIAQLKDMVITNLLENN